MVRLIFRVLVLVNFVSLASTSIAADVQTIAKSGTPHDRLFRLFNESDEASLKRNPISAIIRGDLRYADQFGDGISDDYLAKERAANQTDLASLKTINRASLNPNDQVAYDVFEFSIKNSLRGSEPEIGNLSKVLPLNHFYGMQTFYPTFSSGIGGAPFKTITDYENALKRHDGYVIYLDRAIARFKEGEVAGVFDTKMTIRNVIEQLNTQLKQPIEDSAFFRPVKNFPRDFNNADKTRFETAYRAAISSKINPAIKSLRDFLETSYLPKARDGYGLMFMKGGDKLYRYLVESTTTLPLTPEEIHETGLKEVARIISEMNKVKEEVDFRGSLPQFFEHLRTDAKFKIPTRERMTQLYYDIGKSVDAKLKTYFSTLPKAALEIRPYEPFREKFEAGGSYDSGTPDGSRPGVFYFNAYDLPSRTIPGTTTLYLHEGAPGHHFQISLAQENAVLPPFMRFGGNTAFVEGWALYSETLGYDMGFYKDPIQRFGTLSDEMLRAMRLVVDTGIHTKGWSREKAIDYMMANSDMGKTDATAEIERYIAIPSQALAYKIGALTIQQLRKKAETKLGDKFDIREFHAQVLMTGALPLRILEEKIERWIDQTK